MHLARIFRHTPQPRLLKAELLFDHPEGVLSLGTDVSLLQAEAVPARAVSIRSSSLPSGVFGSEVGAFYWTVPAPGIVNSGREEQGSVSV